jgi:hypothetical protein
MKVTLNIRDQLRNMADTDHMLTFEASVDVDQLFETGQFSDEVEFDLDELLKQNRIIADLWTIDDVRDLHPHLSEDQAWEVLRECQDRLNSEVGINWEQIEKVADDLFGEATQRLIRFNDMLEQYTDGDTKQNLVDLLADAIHWSQVNDADFDGSLVTARLHILNENNA